jgi:hypothetical protein
LVKESGIESYDLDSTEDSDYKPADYSVNQGELQLEEVLTDLEQSPHYDNVINVVTKQWDQASKQIVAENPQLLTTINGQMANGVYEKVSNEVERQRMFGRLVGLSDIEAYKQVGGELHSSGAFDSLAGNESSPKRKVITKNPKANNAKRTSKKRAGSVKASKPAPQQKLPDNLDKLSDAEFEKVLAKFS